MLRKKYLLRNIFSAPNNTGVPKPNDETARDFSKDTILQETASSNTVSEDVFDFHYNPFHDVEPIIWIIVWFLLSHVPRKPTTPLDSKQTEAQLDLYMKLFYDSNDGSERVNSFLVEGLANVYEVLHPDFLDSRVSTVLKYLVKAYKNEYGKIQASPSFVGATTPELLRKCSSKFYDQIS